MKRRNIVGDNIRRLREAARLTQEELALKSGLSQGYVNQLESGKRRYTQKSLELIAGTLAVAVIDFFREEEAKDVPGVAEKIVKYERKRPARKELLSLLERLPDHIVEHYLTLLKLEREIWRKRL
jgi:transcriptional regulator with XRE-family HTH domain